MTDQEDNSLREPSSLEKFLTFVKEYKEVGAAIAFVVTAISYVLTYFATKEEFHTLDRSTFGQYKRLECLLQTHYQLLEGKELSKIYRDELMIVLEELRMQAPSGTQFSGYDTKKIIQLDRRQAPSGTQFSAYDTKKNIQLEQQKDDLNRKIQAAENQESEATTSIRLGKCDK